MNQTQQQQLLLAAVTLFVIYYFFVKPRHVQFAETTPRKMSILGQLGFGTDSKVLEYFVLTMPFLYALRSDLKLDKLFESLGVTDKSMIVNL